MALSSTRHALYTISMTCVEDGRSHQITEEQMIAGRRARTGSYLAICGHTVTATSMVAPDGRPCSRCHHHSAHLAGVGHRPGRHRQRRRLWRLLGGQRSPIPPVVPTHLNPARRDNWAPTAAGPESTPSSFGPAASHPADPRPALIAAFVEDVPDARPPVR